jgi:GT2 family glycosyltransferase
MTTPRRESTPPDVSVIVVSYNTSALTRDTLRSVFEHTSGIDFEVIVVDNASQDGSAADIRAEFPRVRLLALTENLGFGRANNRGMEVARGRNLFLLNPDTLLHDNAVKTLSDWLDANPGCGVCGGNLIDEQGRPEHSFLRMLPGPAAQWNSLLGGLPSLVRYGRNREYNHTRRPMDVGYITGADMMVRASVIAEVGGFDPDFFLYYEETELTARIRRAGYRVVSIPSVKITHLSRKSPIENEARSRRILQGWELYMRKVYGPEKARRINRLALFSAYAKAIVVFWNPKMRRKLRLLRETLSGAGITRE